jgi:hypothetical protein
LGCHTGLPPFPVDSTALTVYGKSPLAGNTAADKIIWPFTVRQLHIINIILLVGKFFLAD